MADAKQCDRCGKFCPSFKSYKLETNAISGNFMKTYDLCPACAGVLQRWWLDAEAEEEEEPLKGILGDGFPRREPGDHNGI